MLGSCVGIFVLAVLYEGLKVMREDLLRWDRNRKMEMWSKPSTWYELKGGCNKPALHVLIKRPLLLPYMNDTICELQY